MGLRWFMVYTSLYVDQGRMCTKLCDNVFLLFHQLLLVGSEKWYLHHMAVLLCYELFDPACPSWSCLSCMEQFEMSPQRHKKSPCLFWPAVILAGLVAGVKSSPSLRSVGFGFFVCVLRGCNFLRPANLFAWFTSIGFIIVNVDVQDFFCQLHYKQGIMRIVRGTEMNMNIDLTSLSSAFRCFILCRHLKGASMCSMTYFDWITGSGDAQVSHANITPMSAIRASELVPKSRERQALGYRIL